MKNLLILIVAIALFLHFYPQPEVEQKYEEIKTQVLNAFSDATDTKIRLKADKVYTDLKPELDSFSKEEVNYLKEITKDRRSVKNFYDNYCEDNKPTSVFHSTNLNKVCKAIGNYQSLL